MLNIYQKYKMNPKTALHLPRRIDLGEIYSNLKCVPLLNEYEKIAYFL